MRHIYEQLQYNYCITMIRHFSCILTLIHDTLVVYASPGAQSHWAVEFVAENAKLFALWIVASIWVITCPPLIFILHLPSAVLVFIRIMAVPMHKWIPLQNESACKRFRRFNFMADRNLCLVQQLTYFSLKNYMWNDQEWCFYLR